jgi:capsule polysaccharide export protein KpsE/RkpR
MAEEKQKAKKVSRIGLDSRFWKTFIVVLAAFFTFAGPTYVIYVLRSFLDINFTVSVIFGFVLFVAGLTLDWYLIKNKVVS